MPTLTQYWCGSALFAVLASIIPIWLIYTDRLLEGLIIGIPTVLALGFGMAMIASIRGQ